MQHACKFVRAKFALCLQRIWANFGLFLPKSALVSAWGNFFLCGETLETFWDQSALLGEHLSQKLPLPSPNNPIFSAKDVLFRVQKYLPKKCFLGFLSKGRLNLWARYAKPKTQINFFFLGATLLIQNSNFRVQGCFFNNCIEKNQNKTHSEEGSSSHNSLRDGSRYQIR